MQAGAAPCTKIVNPYCKEWVPRSEVVSVCSVRTQTDISLESLTPRQKEQVIGELYQQLNDDVKRRGGPEAIDAGLADGFEDITTHLYMSDDAGGYFQGTSMDGDTPTSGKKPLLERIGSLKMGHQLSTEQNAQLTDLLVRWDQAFAWTPEEIGEAKCVAHRIDVGTAEPIKQRAYRLSPAENEAVRTEIGKMLRAGVIRPSMSAWASPVVLVPKPNGTIRFCIDYRKINAVTKKDVYPLPRIDEALDALSGARYFSALDLKSGYWQIPMSAEDAEKTAFITKYGLYEFVRLPFGLTGAPAIFQRIMDKIFRDMLWRDVIVYLDDIIIYTRTWSQHLTVLAEVMRRLDEAGLRISPEKSDFAFDELLYLGHVVNGGTVKPNPKKVSAVKDLARPTGVPQLRSFLGLASYYRRFIRAFARISAPLTILLRKGVEYIWSDMQEQAFEMLKERLVAAPILRAPDFEKPFIVQTDWSKEAIAAILSQKENDEEYVVAYASRRCSKTEAKYAPVEGECLAARWGIEYFRPYLYGRRFTLQTDQSALRYLMTTTSLTGHLFRWSLRLQAYDFDIVHRPGKQHANVDALTRMPIPTEAGRGTST